MTRFDREAFCFNLPPDRIAQHPAKRRDHARLLVAEGNNQPIHSRFDYLQDYLRAGDVLVLNRTRVMNARCFGQKENGVRLEMFVLDLQADPRHFPVMVRPAKRVKSGTVIRFPKSGMQAVVVAKEDDGRVIVDLADLATVLEVIEQDGQLPLPPYIKRAGAPGTEDQQRYQTVFADQLGAVAAPTAGLHFTEELLTGLQDRGVKVVYVTHHVGIGTFKPLTAEDIRDHVMETESYEMTAATATTLNTAKQEERRIIAVGTTSTRCLEANFDCGFHAGKNNTDLYIYPGYEFQAIDGLITNFHLPGSSLILLVSALVGTDRIRTLYEDAIQREYRFYSYGDAMFLVP